MIDTIVSSFNWYLEHFLYIHVFLGVLAGMMSDIAVLMYRGKTFHLNIILTGIIGGVIGPLLIVCVALYDIVIDGWYSNTF